MAPERVVRIAVEGVAARLEVGWARGVERLHEPFAIEVSVCARDSVGAPVSVDLDALLGCKATVGIALGDGGERNVHGVVDDVEQGYAELRLTVVPRVAPLRDAVDYRVFLSKDAVAIARDVLQEHGIDVATRAARSLPERAQCVQAFESDLAFVSRILAEEGITWFTEQTSAADVVVFADSRPPDIARASPRDH
jgi:type VI secretion system secreted protein VgrG